LLIYRKDTLAHTFAIASIDVDEIPEQEQLNSQDESSDDGSRPEADFHVLSDASPDEVVPEADEQKEGSNQLGLNFRQQQNQSLKDFERNMMKRIWPEKLRKEKDHLTRRDFTLEKPQHVKVLQEMILD
jgi:hypothetical protein